MRVSTPFAECLESRTLMSASPLNSAVKADQLQTQSDLLKFRADAIACYATLMTDIAAIKADDLKAATTVDPLVKTMRADIKALDKQLLADRLGERSNVLADESIIVADERQLLLDHGNKNAVAADHVKLRADRIKMQNDMIAGLNARLADRQAGYTKIFADGQAIVTAAGSDPNASPQLLADLTKWTTDKAACMNTRTADIQKLIADRTQLVTDLTALQPT